MFGEDERPRETGRVMGRGDAVQAPMEGEG